jgi:hypothetical protein
LTQDLSDTLHEAAQDVPEELGAWLGRLVLLYGVPFSYLIPDEQMLPRESIRFFFLDPIWIQCLVQGACSIGNNGFGDTMIDRAMDKWVQPNQPVSREQGVVVNKTAAGIRDALRNQREGTALPEEGEDLNWPLTGFLLRSAVVAGWRGLEVMAYSDVSDTGKDEAVADVPPLKPLRIEQLSPDVMLGVFNGIIGRLVVRQPQEGLHFGLTRRGQSCSKTLRELGYKDPSRAGEVLQDQTIDLSQRNLMREARGVIDIAALAGKMQDALSRSGELAGTAGAQAVKFTSAEFAVQMIEAAGEFTFIQKRVQT